MALREGGSGKMKDISVQYLGGSGFLVTVDETGMLFDFSENGSDERVMPDKKELASLKRVYVFVSHRHDTHFSPTVYDLCGERAVYVLGEDVPLPHKGVRMKPGEERGLGPVTVRAFGSTDEGVSFLVEYLGIRIFHAGDLNLWHWRDESSINEIAQAEKAFYDCVAPIPVESIDVAFFPVDPRQGSMYDAGAGYFVMTVKPRIMIPMHFQGRGDVALRFALTGETSATKIVAIEHAGDSVSLSIPESEDSAPDRKLRDFIEGKLDEDEDENAEG